MKKAFTQKEIPQIAHEVIERLLTLGFRLSTSKATIVALSGDLGAGKTTLTQAIAKELGIKEKVISPTFILMKHYPIRLSTLDFKLLTHVDAYRFDSSSELLKLGWNDLISDPKNLILIEWPEKVAEIIPKDAIRVSLSHKDEHTRHVDIS